MVRAMRPWGPPKGLGGEGEEGWSCWVLLDSIVFFMILLDSNGFGWMLLDADGSFWILLDSAIL